MFKGPTYKASFYLQQQLFLKVLRQSSKSFGGQNTIKVFCHPPEKNKKKKHSVDMEITRAGRNVRCPPGSRVNFSEPTVFAHALIV